MEEDCIKCGLYSLINNQKFLSDELSSWGHAFMKIRYAHAINSSFVEINSQLFFYFFVIA